MLTSNIMIREKPIQLIFERTLAENRDRTLHGIGHFNGAK